MSRITDYNATIYLTESKEKDSIETSAQYPSVTDPENWFSSYESKKVLFDKNYFALNGESGTNGWNFLPDGYSYIGFLSSEKSDINGEFTIPQYALIELAEISSSIGIWFRDLHGRSLERKITIYDQAMTMIKELTIDSTEELSDFYIVNPVKNFKYVKFEITKTVPYSHAMNIYWSNGGALTFDSTSVKAASSIDSTDASLDTLKASTLKLEIVDKDNIFNFGEEINVTDFMTRNNSITSKYTVDDESNYTFNRYIKSSKLNNNILTLSSTCALGLLSDEEFSDVFLQGQTVESVLGQIDSFLLDNFSISIVYNDDIDNLTLDNGIVTGSSMREALRKVLQSIGAVARLSRNAIYIEYPTRTINHNIERSDKISSSVEKKEFVSAVKVNYSTWEESTETTTLAETETLTVGYHTITWDTPATNISITGFGGFLESSTTYSAYVQVTSETSVTVTGNEYVETQMSYTESLDTSLLSDVGTTEEYTNRACNYERAVAMAQYLLNYHQLRLKIKTKYLMDGTEGLGDWAFIEDSNGTTKYMAGIENMSIDLTGGVICDLETVGYYDHKDEFAYTGTEIYTGEELLL